VRKARKNGRTHTDGYEGPATAWASVMQSEQVGFRDEVVPVGKELADTHMYTTISTGRGCVATT